MPLPPDGQPQECYSPPPPWKVLGCFLWEQCLTTRFSPSWWWQASVFSSTENTNSVPHQFCFFFSPKQTNSGMWRLVGFCSFFPLSLISIPRCNIQHFLWRQCPKISDTSKGLLRTTMWAFEYGILKFSSPTWFLEVRKSQVDIRTLLFRPFYFFYFFQLYYVMSPYSTSRFWYTVPWFTVCM